MTDKPLPSEFELFSTNPAFRADPDALLDDLRARCPVRLDPQSKGAILTRHADVRSVVNERRTWRHPARADPNSFYHQFRKRPDGSPPRQDTEDDSILFLDDPDHARVRQPLALAFNRRVAKMREPTRRIVEDVLKGLGTRSEIDVIDDLGVPIPIYAIAEILGVEKRRLPEFRAWSEAIILSLNPFRTSDEDEKVRWAERELQGFFLPAMAERRARPRDDLLTDMVELQAEGAPLTDLEIGINCSALLVGGNLTTTDLIGNGVLLFLSNPDQLALLRSDPKLINGAVEEILRLEGPVLITSRIAAADMEIGGCPIGERTPILNFLRAANRDPMVYKDPARFDITRKEASHVGFGGGAHICIGAPLARLEAQIALPMIFECWPNMRLAEPELIWR